MIVIKLVCYRNALLPSVSLSVFPFHVRALTYICIDELPSYLVQMLSSFRRCAVTLTWIHTSQVKVTGHIKRSEYTCSYPAWLISVSKEILFIDLYLYVF